MFGSGRGMRDASSVRPQATMETLVRGPRSAKDPTVTGGDHQAEDCDKPEAQVAAHLYGLRLRWAASKTTPTAVRQNPATSAGHGLLIVFAVMTNAAMAKRMPATTQPHAKARISARSR